MHTKALFNANQFDLGKVSLACPTSNVRFMVTQLFIFSRNGSNGCYFYHISSESNMLIVVFPVFYFKLCSKFVYVLVAHCGRLPVSIFTRIVNPTLCADLTLSSGESGLPKHLTNIHLLYANYV